MFAETSRLFLCLTGQAEEVGFEPTEGFDTLDRFQDGSVMTTPAPLRAFGRGPCENYRFIIRAGEFSVNRRVWGAQPYDFLVNYGILDGFRV